MKAKILLFVVCFTLLAGFVWTGSGLAYYYPSTANVPPGLPPNYNQVDISYFLGTPILPLPPPDDSGGFYVYYDQGSWCVANHIYSPGGSMEQFHGCILAVMSQPPTQGVNVFIEELELWGDTSGYKCLQQNDRWGWYPWGDSLYEIWWDFSTKEWKNGAGDPNDYICFKITGCAVDFNLWSSGHERPWNEFTTSRIWLGSEKVLLSSIPGLSDTYPGIDDAYQTAVGDPRDMPNTTIFTPKSSTPRSYNMHGLINPTDTYSCTWAPEYGERYAGTFVYEGNGVQFSTTSLCPSNRDPKILITPDTSLFLCAGDSVKIWIYATDPDAGDIITVEKISGMGTYTPQTGASPISDEFYFHPDTGGVYKFIFRVTDDQGAMDEDTSLVTVEFNLPPELTCPDDGSVQAGEKFISADFSASDPKCWPLVTLCGIEPSATNPPQIVGSHVEWQTTCAEEGVYTICLEVEDKCGAKDTCYFDVTVYNQPLYISCPEDDSVLAPEKFISSDFAIAIPLDKSLPVSFCGVIPAPVNQPTIVDRHVEWQTDCADAGKVFTICLQTTGACETADSCSFQVTVYNQQISISCPENDSVHAQEKFISSDFVTDIPLDKSPVVSFCGVTPAPVNQPTIVDRHVEWQTDCADAGKVFTICLQTTGVCETADSCSFQVTVYNRPPQLTCPEDGMVQGGATFVSGDFSASDPDGDSAPVSFLDIDPPAANDPTLVSDHVEWVTTTGEDGDYIIRLIATDPCGLADTCEFTVTVVNEPTGDFSCPDDDSVHAGELFVSTNYSLTYPECDPSSVEILDITPTPTHAPILVGYHVEWPTTCDEDGEYIIRLRTNQSCSIEDTCSFIVTVYNRPPELTCPDYGQVKPLGLFISTDFYFFDPDGDNVLVSLIGIDPPALYDPIIVEHHVEWQTECIEGDYIITLVVTDPCGLADTCDFMVTVAQDPVPDFYIWIYPTVQYVSQGQSAGYLIELNSINGFAMPCSLYVSGMPAPPYSAAFDDVVMTPTQYTNMTVFTLPQTDLGTYTLTVTGKEIDGYVAHSTQVQLNVMELLGPADVEDDAGISNTPKTFTLFQNMPNPFNPETQINYFLPIDCQISVTIYNLLGQKVRTLFEGYQTSGVQSLTWNGRSDQGEQLSSGIYFYRLQADNFVETKKMTLMK
jgi:hypothetical protein